MLLQNGIDGGVFFFGFLDNEESERSFLCNAIKCFERR
jgi:hypothetical protein